MAPSERSHTNISRLSSELPCGLYPWLVLKNTHFCSQNQNLISCFVRETIRKVQPVSEVSNVSTFDATFRGHKLWQEKTSKWNQPSKLVIDKDLGSLPDCAWKGFRSYLMVSTRGTTVARFRRLCEIGRIPPASTRNRC